jgi:hypothetical protein
MNETRRKPIIMAKTADEFVLLDERIRALPYLVYSQLSNVKMFFGSSEAECEIENPNNGSEELMVYLPKTIQAITTHLNLNSISIYCEGYIFVINGNIKTKAINYSFVDAEKWE